MTAPQTRRDVVLRAVAMLPLLTHDFEARAQQAGASAVTTVLGRLRAYYAGTFSAAQAPKWLSQQAPSGEWADVNYPDRSVGAWRPMAHLERSRAIAALAQSPASSSALRSQALRALEQGLRAWLARKPVSDNWWHNTIGQQLALAPILVLTQGQLPRDLTDALTAMLYDPSMVEPDRATGQNLVWYATEQLVRGALRADGNDLQRASDALQSTLRITLEEGVQPDFSFHQHGPQLYSGGYGLGFLTDSVRAAGWLADTPWAFSPTRLDLLADYALMGLLPLVRGDWLDWGARGREFTRNEAIPRPRLLRAALEGLRPLVPSRAAALGQALARLAGKGPLPGNEGNRYYWRSDFMVHQTTRGYASVKMVSSRTVGTESGNGENLLGYWLPFGVTFLLRLGDEYDQMPPLWDWSALPGLTAPSVVPRFTGYQRHDQRFVGGLSDGKAGVAAMRLNKADTTARRSWFFVGDLMVALGSAVASTSPEPVRTTLDHRRARGPVHTDVGPVAPGGGPVDVSAREWVWHDGVTYLLNGAGAVKLVQARRAYMRSDINTDLGSQGGEQDVFMLAIEHGAKPRDVAYRYAVWFGADAPGQAGRAPAFKVTSNTVALHSVHHPATGLTQAVFWEPATLAVADGVTLAVDTPCLVTLQATALGWQLQASDPSQTARRIGMTVKWPSGGPDTFELAMPATAAGQRSVGSRALLRKP